MASKAMAELVIKVFSKRKVRLLEGGQMLIANEHLGQFQMQPQEEAGVEGAESATDVEHTKQMSPSIESEDDEEAIHEPTVEYSCLLVPFVPYHEAAAILGRCATRRILTIQVLRCQHLLLQEGSLSLQELLTLHSQDSLTGLDSCKKANVSIAVDSQWVAPGGVVVCIPLPELSAADGNNGCESDKLYVAAALDQNGVHLAPSTFQEALVHLLPHYSS